MAGKKKDLAKFGITDFTSKGIRALDWKKIDDEFVLKHDEKARTTVQKRLASRAKELPAAQGGAVPEQLATVPTNSQSSDGDALLSGGSAQSLQRPSDQQVPSNVTLPDRSVNQQDAMQGVNMSVPEVGCVPHWVYGTCTNNAGSCTIGSHNWLDSIVEGAQFKGRRKAHTLPAHTLRELLKRNL